MSTISIKNLNKAYGKVQVLHDINLEIGDNAFVVFVGPSGCGKSTLLRTIAGLEERTSGAIHLDGRDISDDAPVDRDVAMVFQSYALYPQMTVRENIGFALRMAKVDKAEIDRKVLEAAKLLKLDKLLDRKPKDLSGGQRQRVAIGRAILRSPKVFLFDEPLSNLDAELRVDMRLQIAALRRELSATFVYVTHDQVEAMTLADTIVVLRDGHIEQVGAPMELYHRPANRFVAGFIGSPRMNFLPATAQGKRAVLADGGALPLVHEAPEGAKLALGLRPEHLRPADDGAIAVTISEIENLGPVSYAHCALADGTLLTAQLPPDHALRLGQAVKLAAEPAHLHVFDASGARIGGGAAHG
ncbi:ABC transporter ATP-binding protein [Abyssibius alkaniclasticus]|uniref:ABC transporter ATP-binding protein n=1 Tax=Abyssibius alkaniclasticus TaxID=2881234 RepID=UPI004058BF63